MFCSNPFEQSKNLMICFLFFFKKIRLSKAWHTCLLKPFFCCFSQIWQPRPRPLSFFSISHALLVSLSLSPPPFQSVSPPGAGRKRQLKVWTNISAPPFRKKKTKKSDFFNLMFCVSKTACAALKERRLSGFCSGKKTLKTLLCYIATLEQRLECTYIGRS